MSLLLENIDLKGGLIYPSNYGFRLDIPFEEQTWLHSEDILRIRYYDGDWERYFIDLGWHQSSSFKNGVFKVEIFEYVKKEEILDVFYRRFTTDLTKLKEIITNCVEVIEENRCFAQDFNN